MEREWKVVGHGWLGVGEEKKEERWLAWEAKFWLLEEAIEKYRKMEKRKEKEKEKKRERNENANIWLLGGYV